MSRAGDRILNAYRSRRLRLRLATGRAQLGREPGAAVEVRVPVRAAMSMRVIRADGAVEDHGEIGVEYKEVDPALLDALRQQAGG